MLWPPGTPLGVVRGLGGAARISFRLLLPSPWPTLEHGLAHKHEARKREASVKHASVWGRLCISSEGVHQHYLEVGP